MAASLGDAHPYPIYNARYRVLFPILDADGDLVTAAAALDSELSQDQGTFADATNEATEIATSSGMYYLDLIATELDTKSTAIVVKTSTAGAKTTPMVLYPKRLPVIRTGTAQAGAATTITLDAGASAQDDAYLGCYVNITNNSPANALGQARRIVGYVGSTKVATVEVAWGTNPSSASTFEVLLTEEAGHAVAFGGVAAPLVGGKVESNVGTVTASAITAAAIAADAIGASELAADAVAEIQAGLATAAAVAAVQADTDNLQTRIPAALIAGRMDSDVAVIEAGAIKNTSFTVDAIDANAIAASAVAEIQSGLATAAALASVQADTDDLQTRVPSALVGGRIDATVGAMQVDVLTAAAVAPDALGAVELAADAAAEIADAVWDEAVAGHGTPGTYGERFKVIYSGQVSGATTTTTLIDSGLTETDVDHWKGRVAIFTDGTLRWQAAKITAFDPALDKITFDPVTTAPTAGPGGSRYIIV